MTAFALKSAAVSALLLATTVLSAQENKPGYLAGINAHISKYVSTHGVVKGKDRDHLHFFAPDSSYRVIASFEKVDDAVGFTMSTSGKMPQHFFRYGRVRFAINGTEQALTVYQSRDLMQVAQYKNYLFIPFTDASTGTTTYEGGRYIDIETSDIKSGKVTIDFNKAYNPYCAYVAGYNCPIPPKENTLRVSINAGEQKYTKPVH